MVSPALKLLADSDNKESRPGMIYYAELDEYQHMFFRHLTHYLPLNSTTNLVREKHRMLLTIIG